MPEPPLHPETIAVAAGRDARPGAPLNVPPIPTSTYREGGDTVYGRDDNPTWAALEEALGALEGGHAVAFSSGMAAIDAVFAALAPRVAVVPAQAYYGVRKLAEAYRERGWLELRTVDVADTPAVLRAAEGADLVLLESPTNPLLAVADVPAVCTGARDLGARVVVDNTVATPMARTPLGDGADMVVHSATKWIGGHSDLLLGCAVAGTADLRDALAAERQRSGAIPGILEAFLALRGLRTLALRMERAQRSAAVLAERLSAHPRVERVRYPGFAALLAFEVAGGREAAEAVVAGLRLVVSATSLGGVETLIERRAKYPADAAAGVPESLLRLSVGCEHVEDVWADLRRALDAL